MEISFTLQYSCLKSISLFIFRFLAHSYATARGSEEREKRQNYRPVIEHDGLPLSQADNQVNCAFTYCESCLLRDML